MNYLISGLTVGAVGDVGLQIANNIGLGNAGLKDYFNNESSALRIAQASALTGFWSFAGSKLSNTNFLLFVGGVDVFYRFNYEWLYPSLEEYYKENGFIETILYNIISGALVLFTNEIL